MPLDPEQIRVTSFETAARPEPGALQPYTAPQPNCYSPFCIPTELPDQCPDKTTVVTG